MVPVLHPRWKRSGRILCCYGLPGAPRTLRRRVRISKKTGEILGLLDGGRTREELPNTRGFQKLIRLGIVVDAPDAPALPASFAEARFCKQCCANDYMIPGLSLNREGFCPLCESAQRYSFARNVLPIPKSWKKEEAGKYDVAVFYTGGKDSSFLLYYLSRVEKLRVLALTWDMPYLSENARQSIENARQWLPEVEFIQQKIPDTDLRRIYQKAYGLQGNVCICPSPAYALFYPLLVKERVPCLVLGNEPAQCKSLIYNQMAPAFSYRPGVRGAARLLFNLGRLLRLRRPLRAGQFELLLAVRNLAFGRSRLLRYVRYRNPLVENAALALRESPGLMEPFRRAVKESSRSGSLPALVHVDFSDVGPGGRYDWEAVKALLRRELGWVDSPKGARGLHTSCRIERCKEYTQLIRFRRMESDMIPFSALEMPLAVLEGSLSREEAIRELRECSGFSPEEPAELEEMRAYFMDKP